uniref:Uncharacterized protein n=1 Tax=Geospiza parvula TaxID=87175 RepID=A0A8U8CDR3_GEOPR
PVGPPGCAAHPAPLPHRSRSRSLLSPPGHLPVPPVLLPTRSLGFPGGAGPHRAPLGARGRAGSPGPPHPPVAAPGRGPRAPRARDSPGTARAFRRCRDSPGPGGPLPVLAQAWPFLGQYLEKLLQDSVAPAIRASSAHLQSFAFTRVDLGQKPLRVLGVQAHPGTHQKQILLDLNISYVGDVQIDVEVKKFFCKAGVKGMQLHGVLRVILEPLLGEAPIVGALSVFFIRRPTLDINWTGMTNLLDIPGLSSMSDSMIMDSIASYLVLPNRLLLPLLPDLPEAARLRWPLPRVRGGIASWGGLVQGRSDPYALLRVGTQTATSRVIGDSLDPVWDEMSEVRGTDGQGDGQRDRGMDRGTQAVTSRWFPLQEGGQGRLHLRLEWLSLLSDASKLDQVLEKNQKIVAKPDPPSSAILVVYLDRAEGLPVRKAGKEPNPVVQVSVQDVTRESKVVCNTSAPVWEDAFRFFLHDPRNQDVDFQVKDDPRQSPLGSLSLPLSRLLQSPSLSLAEPFPLQRSGPGALLHLQLELRVRRGLRGVPGGFWGPSDPHPPPGAVPGAPRARRGPPGTGGRVLRVQLLEAAALVAKDQRLGGLVRGRSDPYAEVRAAGSRFRSRVVRDELNPRWNESYEVIVDDVPGQDVEFDLFDKDIDKDDFLGRWESGGWLPLQDVRSGRLHVRLESLEPRPSAELLDRVLHTNALLQPQHGPELSAALLRVYLDRAADLPLRKGSQPPRAFASLAVGAASFRTQVGPAGPVWDEGFSFLIRRPHAETLELQVRAEAGPPLGSLSLPLAQLLPRAGLSMDGWVPLPGGGQLLLRAQLGVSAGARGDPPDPKPHPWRVGVPRNEWGPKFPISRRPQPPQGPRVLLSLRLHREQRRLVAIVHSCRDLRAASKEPPDPYVSLALLPKRGRGGSKRKTGVQRRTLNPRPRPVPRFEWELPPEEAPRRRLEATVKSSGNFVTGGKEALGKLQLELAQVDLSEGDPRW